MNEYLLPALANRVSSVLWNEVVNDNDLTSSQKRKVCELARSGLEHGVSLAVRVPGDYGGAISFVADDPKTLNRETQYAVDLIGPYAFDALRRIEHSSAIERQSATTPFTARQMQCLTLIAQGKSDWEAGCILELSGETVHAHIETARRRYGVRRRVQLVVRALYEGRLSYHDVLAA